MKTRLKQRVAELEDDLKKSKEELEKAKKAGGGQGEEGEVSGSLGKRWMLFDAVSLLVSSPVAKRNFWYGSSRDKEEKNCFDLFTCFLVRFLCL